MRQALEQAQSAASQGEVPVGAIVVKSDTVISRAFNLKEQRQLASAHAEIRAIEEANQKLGTWRLSECCLYVTLEPCLMCCGAIIQSRLARVVFGAFDPKGGAVQSLYETLSDPRLNHRPEWVGGVLKKDCGDILSHFFKSLRSPSKEKPNP